MSFARFQELVQKLTEAATWDQAALRKVEEELRELEAIVAQLKRPDLDGLLDGAVLLVRLVPKLDPIEAEDCQRMVVRLVQIALRRLVALRNARKKDLARKRTGGGGTRGADPRPGMAIGDVLVEFGFITPDELEQALAVSKSKGVLVGEVLVAMGKCEREDVARAMFLQKSLQPASAEPQAGDRHAAGGGAVKPGGEDSLDVMLFGEALLRRGWIHPVELLEALRIHKESGAKVGEVLIRLGYANQEQVQEALDWQSEMRAKRLDQGESVDACEPTQGDEPRLPGGAASVGEEALREGLRAVAHVLDVDAPRSPIPSPGSPTVPIRLEDEGGPAEARPFPSGDLL